MITTATIASHTGHDRPLTPIAAMAVVGLASTMSASAYCLSVVLTPATLSVGKVNDVIVALLGGWYGRALVDPVPLEPAPT